MPMQNIIGFYSETANVMMGSKHSVSTLLKLEVPDAIIVQCSLSYDALECFTCLPKVT